MNKNHEVHENFDNANILTIRKVVFNYFFGF